MLDVRMGKWLSVVSNHSALTPSVSVTMWPCACHFPCFIFFSLLFHSSVTMTAGWEGVTVMTVNWELNWKHGVWRTDFESSKCKRYTRPTVCGLRPPQVTHFAMFKTHNYDLQLLKNVSHLNGQVLLKSQTYTNTHLCVCVCHCDAC